MDVATITVDPAAAREKLRQYRHRKHRDAEDQYAAAIALYEAAADGSPLINVADAIAMGEFDNKGRPLLAIARADRKQVCLTRPSYDRVLYFDARSHAHQYSDRYPSLLREVRSQYISQWTGIRVRAYATVPMVPPEVRPPQGQLKDWYILWEVDQWHERPVVDPPVDPILLQHIQGDWYRVLAAWDLTEIEQAAMRLALA